jgi:hypothetical protein
MVKVKLFNAFEIMERAVHVCSTPINFPELTSADERDIYNWMEIVESEAAAKQCLDVLTNSEPLMTDVLSPMPEPNDPNYSAWIEAKNFFNVCMKVREIKAHMMMTEFRRRLSGVPRTYAVIHADSTPHQVWENMRASLQRTITKSSDYAANQWKSVHIKSSKSLGEYLDNFESYLGIYEATRRRLNQSDITEEEKINALFAGLEGSEYAHRTIWLHKPEAEAKKDTVGAYILGLRRDAIVTDSKKPDIALYGSSTYEAEKPYFVPADNKRKYQNEPDRNVKRHPPQPPNGHNGRNKGNNSSNSNNSVDRTPQSNASKPANSNSFPNRRKDKRRMARERNKDKSIDRSKLVCDYCGRNYHTADECHKRERKESGKSFACTDYESEEEIKYRYDDEEKILCLSLRDNCNVPNSAFNAVEIPSNSTSSANTASDTVEITPVERCLMARTKPSTPAWERKHPPKSQLVIQRGDQAPL